MFRHEILTEMALATQAYNETQPCPPGAQQRFVAATNGVEYFTRLDHGVLRITFRGSNSRQDWRNNLAFCKAEVPYDNISSKVRVHGGFLSGYKYPEVRNTLLECAKTVPAIRVAGHSYGAALAALCALDIQYNYPEKDIEAYLFGCPRVGNRAFSISYNKRVIKTIRVENGNDIVTRVPFAIMGFRHVGARFHVGKKRRFWRISACDHYQMAYYEGLLGRLLG